MTSEVKISTSQLLIPMSLISFTLALLLAFQLTQVMRDRDMLQQTVGRMEQQVQDSQKVNAQFGGLVVGTRKLAEGGNEIAKDFVERLKKAGIIMEEPAQALSTNPLPAATETPANTPIKP